MADETAKKYETSEDILMPLPLGETELLGLDEENVTMEAAEDIIRKLYPEINIIPNVEETIIPIIPGITLYSYIRFYNAFPSVTGVDVYLNGKKVIVDLQYRFFSQYLKAFPGYYKLSVYETGAMEQPLLATYINIIGYRIYTAAITGSGTEGELVFINDSIRPLPRRSVFLRFAQTAESAPMINIFLNDELVVSDLEFQEVTRYLTAAPGKYNIKLTNSKTNDIIAEEPSVSMEGGNAYTAYIIGDKEDRVGIQVRVEKEGIAYLNF